MMNDIKIGTVLTNKHTKKEWRVIDIEFLRATKQERVTVYVLSDDSMNEARINQDYLTHYDW